MPSTSGSEVSMVQRDLVPSAPQFCHQWLTFRSALLSFFVFLMKSAFPFKCSSNSPRVMSPFSTRTCGMWGSAQTRSTLSICLGVGAQWGCCLGVTSSWGWVWVLNWGRVWHLWMHEAVGARGRLLSGGSLALPSFHGPQFTLM